MQMRSCTTQLGSSHLSDCRPYPFTKTQLLLIEINQDSAEEEFGIGELKEAYLALIRTHEKAENFNRCLNLLSTDASRLQERLLELLRVSFYARYGDMFADVCTKLKAEAQKKQVPGHESLSKQYWTEIADKLHGEADAWKGVMSGKMTHKECPIHLALYTVSTSSGFNLKEILAIIAHYAKRNELLHANITSLIKHGKFHDLNARLSTDLEDLRRMQPQLDEFEADLMSKLIKAMIVRWFVISPMDPTNTQSWIPSPEVLKMWEELAGGASEAAIKKKMMATITKDVAKSFREKESEEKLAQDLEDNFSLSTSTLKKEKRVASHQLEAELKKAKKQKKDYDHILGMAAGVRSRSEAYAEEYGSLKAPKDVVHDPLLD